MAGEDAVDAVGSVAGRADRRRAHLRGGRASRPPISATSSTARRSRPTRCSSPRAPASGLITTQGFGQILHLARSQTPGPLAGWIIMVKPDPPASLADTREAVERMDARGEHARRRSTASRSRAIVERPGRLGRRVADDQLINSYVNGAPRAGDRRPRRGAAPGLPGDDLQRRAAGVPRVRADADGLHELLRAPAGGALRRRLQSSLNELGVKTEVDILRSDAGVMTPREAARNPVYGVLSRAVGRRRGRAVRGRAGGLSRTC